MDEPFDSPAIVITADDQFVLDLEGYEGPIDVLLTLARQQKVDLARISILELADQYLGFVARARRLKLELAADYLVMAAWLCYLKSRLLLPELPEDAGPSAPDLAEALSFQLRRLEAMREAGQRLMRLARLGIDVFARGAPEGVEIVRRPIYTATLFETLKAYGDFKRTREVHESYHIAQSEIYSVTDALQRFKGLMGKLRDWQNLLNFLPPGMMQGTVLRSVVAATFVATLELARRGEIEIRQHQPFGPIYIRRGAGTNERRDIHEVG